MEEKENAPEIVDVKIDPLAGFFADALLALEKMTKLVFADDGD